ncbi:hypothetical protein SUDANB1_05592 [Streptomyces sp. enrichment culture]|uniref:hypothetical protein n=1 Tax=Streptomyces sp. enrichment culture TaxID=1795815 RepID=UPI003F543803
MDSKELEGLVSAALVAAIEGDADAAATAVCTLGERSGRDQFEVYAACCAFAEAAKQALVKIYDDQVPDVSRGEMWSMHQLPGADAAETWAMRFVVAYSNDDKPQAMALWRTALNQTDEDYVASVAAVLSTAASLWRTVKQQEEGNR